MLITASGVRRGPKPIALKQIADQACALCAERGAPLQTVLVLANDDAVT